MQIKRSPNIWIFIRFLPFLNYKRLQDSQEQQTATCKLLWLFADVVFVCQALTWLHDNVCILPVRPGLSLLLFWGNWFFSANIDQTVGKITGHIILFCKWEFCLHNRPFQCELLLETVNNYWMRQPSALYHDPGWWWQLGGRGGEGGFSNTGLAKANNLYLFLFFFTENTQILPILWTTVHKKSVNVLK